jgi:predicted NBD/HSP70 family sugar kinase
MRIVPASKPVSADMPPSCVPHPRYLPGDGEVQPGWEPAVASLPEGPLVLALDGPAILPGEWAIGSAAGHRRAAAITLGSGAGSSFLSGGLIVEDDPALLPGRRARNIIFRGRPPEDTVSRRALIAAYSRATGRAEDVDVSTVAGRARQGASRAHLAVTHAMESAGHVMASYLERFRAAILVIGGAMVRSWDLIEGPLRSGLFADRPSSRTPSACGQLSWLMMPHLPAPPLPPATAAAHGQAARARRTLRVDTSR